jgi:hypothetical protein
MLLFTSVVLGKGLELGCSSGRCVRHSCRVTMHSWGSTRPLRSVFGTLFTDTKLVRQPSFAAKLKRSLAPQDSFRGLKAGSHCLRLSSLSILYTPSEKR